MTNPRPVRPDELNELGQLLDSVFRIPRGVTDQHMLTDFPLLFQPDNLRNCRVIVEDGRIVSHAGLWPRELLIGETLLKVGILVAVATHPDYRRRGQAAALVKSLQQTLHDDGYDLGILWTGVPDFYRKIGWEIVQPQGHVVELSAGDELPIAECDELELIPYAERRHLSQLMALHEAEPVRMLRTRDEFASLLELPKVTTCVAEADGSAVAYLVSNGAVNKPGWIESGGSREGIVGLLRQSLKADSPFESRRWIISSTRGDLADWARTVGLTVQRLKSCKGMPKANEMILNCRPERVKQALLDELFVWGLDLA